MGNPVPSSADRARSLGVFSPLECANKGNFTAFLSLVPLEGYSLWTGLTDDRASGGTGRALKKERRMPDLPREEFGADFPTLTYLL